MSVSCLGQLAQYQKNALLEPVDPFVVGEWVQFTIIPPFVQCITQELRFAQEQTSPLPDYEEDVERDRRRRSSSRTRHITEIEVQPVTTTGEQYQGNAGHYGTLKITTIEHSEPR